MKTIIIASSAFAVGLAEPNPPSWPSSVAVFDESTPAETIDAAVSAAFASNGGDGNLGQFSDERYAFLFKPGSYANAVPVGYYTEVLGLGHSPDDTVFAGARGVYCVEGDSQYEVGALDTFWRAAANFRTAASFGWWEGGAGMLWAVSQAAPLRRVHVDNDLLLFQRAGGGQAGYASGGFVADSRVEGAVVAGSQQQFLARNCELVGGWSGGVWNTVFVGVENAPTAACDQQSETLGVVVARHAAPVAVEKPYVRWSAQLEYELVVPRPRREARGTSWSKTSEAGEDAYSFSRVHVADAASADAASIQEALDAGLHVVLAPGIYELDAPLVLVRENQVLLGLGLATLRGSATNTGGLVTGRCANGRVAGLLLEAGPAQGNAALLEWAGDSADAFGGALSDVFARAGVFRRGAPHAAARTMLQVDAARVVGDNLWLWRADHDVEGSVFASRNPVDHGALVTGSDVTMYGLAVEHALKDLVVWSGENGTSYFYQSELPYDVDAAYGAAAFCAYRVAPHVSRHCAHGAGAYAFFRDFAVRTPAAMVAPSSARFYGALTVFLGGQGSIESVLTGRGRAVGPNGRRLARICDSASLLSRGGGVVES